MLSSIDKDFWWQPKLTSELKTQKASCHSYYKAFGQSSKKRIPRSWGYPQLNKRKSYDNSKMSLPMDSSAWKKTPKRIIHNLGNLLQQLEFVPDSRKHVVPTEWQVRTVPGDCKNKAKVISTRAPQYRQYVLMSDFLDLAKLSFGDEAAVTTNWIKDRPE